MNLDPTAIRETSTPAEVLAAFLPIVQAAFREPWGVWISPHEPLQSPFLNDFDEQCRLGLRGYCEGIEEAWCRADQVWACVAASYLMGPLMEFVAAETAYLRVSRDDLCDLSDDDAHHVVDVASRAIRAREALDAAALRLRDEWCAKRREAGT